MSDSEFEMYEAAALPKPATQNTDEQITTTKR